MVWVDKPVVTATANRESARAGDYVEFNVTVTGATGSVSYLWQKSSDGITWSSAGFSGYKTATMYFDAIKSLGEVIVLKKRELLGSLFFVSILMLISSLLMYSAEHEAQPEVFRNAFSGLWWAVATLTTVGYGDIYPVTALGRLLGAFIAFSGLAAVAIPTGIISSGLMEALSRGREAKARAEKVGEEQPRDRVLRDCEEALKAISDKLAQLQND